MIDLEPPLIHVPFTFPFAFPTFPTKTFVSVSTSPTPPFEFEHPSQSCQAEKDLCVAENWEKRVTDVGLVNVDKDQNKENTGHASEIGL